MAAKVSSLEVDMVPDLLRIFFPLLQEGVEVEVEVGCSVKELLTEQFGIRAEYIAGRITTLFLNSKAVDDAAKAIIHDGAVLALSGAMPGLVGATMRSGGFYAAMRGAMTYRDEPEADSPDRHGRIKLKLFNLLLEELGPRLLVYGVLLSWERLREFLRTLPKNFRLSRCRLDGTPVAMEGLLQEGEAEKPEERVELKVYFGERSP